MSHSGSRKRSNAENHLPQAKRESRAGTKRPRPQPLAEEPDDELEVEEASAKELELSQLPSQDMRDGTLSFVSFVHATAWVY